MFKKMQNRKGFSLIEMLIVIAIIAILVAIIVPVVGASRTKAQAAADAANLRSVAAEAGIIYNEASLTNAEPDFNSLVDPGSKLNPNASIIGYKVGGEIVCLYTTSYFGNTIDRISEALKGNTTTTVSGYGIPYNTLVATDGDRSHEMDVFEGEYLFSIVNGQGFVSELRDAADKGLESIKQTVTDLTKYLSSLTPEEAAKIIGEMDANNDDQITIMDFADKDGNQTLSKDEYMSFLNVKEDYYNYDSNKDGWVTSSEYKKATGKGNVAYGLWQMANGLSSLKDLFS